MERRSLGSFEEISFCNCTASVYQLLTSPKYPKCKQTPQPDCFPNNGIYALVTHRLTLGRARGGGMALPL